MRDLALAYTATTRKGPYSALTMVSLLSMTEKCSVSRSGLLRRFVDHWTRRPIPLGKRGGNDAVKSRGYGACYNMRGVIGKSCVVTKMLAREGELGVGMNT